MPEAIPYIYTDRNIDGWFSLVHDQDDKEITSTTQLPHSKWDDC